MVNPSGGAASASSTRTGRRGSKPPPAAGGSPVTGSGAVVEEMGFPEGRGRHRLVESRDAGQAGVDGDRDAELGRRRRAPARAGGRRSNGRRR